MTRAGPRGYVAASAAGPMPEIESRGFAPVPGGQLYFERAGTGPALVLIHSAFLDCREWDPQMDSFARTHTVVRYDVRGWGRSAGDRTEVSDGEDLTALLNHLDVRQAFVLGNSNGARIAAEFAAGFPDRTRGLILVAGGPHDLDPTPEEQARFMDSMDQEQRLLDLVKAGRKPEAVEVILDIWAPQVPGPERDRLRGITAENYEQFVTFMTSTTPPGRPPSYPVQARLRQGDTPILSIAGAHDEPALTMMMGRFAQEAPSARFHLLPDGDHTPSLSARAEFEAVVLEFLTTVETRGTWPPRPG